MTVQLLNPEHLQFMDHGRLYYGADQDWFNSFWQRKAGCGPTTGAHIALYLARTGRMPLTDRVQGRADFVRLMERSWARITPTVMGLNSTRLMQEGLEGFIKSLGGAAKARVLDVPASTAQRPSGEAAEAFIREGLAGNVPVAFLNLHNGEIPGLDTWHWVTVVGLSGSGEEALLHIYDNGNRLQVPLYHWLRATRRGGGFVFA